MPPELNSDNTTKPASLVQFVEPAEVNRRMALGDSFVVNVVAAWCPDCTESQKPYIGTFAQQMQSQNADVLQVNVQHLKGEFISVEHEQITNQFGGHGYPRTVLIKQGNVVDKDNVEVITEDGLSALARKFIQTILES